MRSLSVVIAFLWTFALPPAHAAPGAELWPLWDESDEDNPQSIDHDPWDDFLGRYIVEDESGINKVAYRQVTDSDRAVLQAYIDQLAEADPRDFSKAEQLGYWVNLYNALTVEVVLRNPNKGTILRMGKGLLSIGPWDDQLLVIAGENVTLNDIEHRILRPIFNDYRIHYAVNCASLGCPNLVAEAYTADNAERLLSQGERAYINHERGVTVDGRGRLKLSQIFQWYGDDFARTEAELLAYLAKHHDTLGETISSYQGKVKYAYDWKLNGAR